MARKTLQQIARHPEGVSLRELLAALRSAGWSLRRHGSKHDAWGRDSGGRVFVPRHRDGIGTGTIRSIAETALTDDEEG